MTGVTRQSRRRNCGQNKAQRWTSSVKIKELLDAATAGKIRRNAGAHLSRSLAAATATAVTPSPVAIGLYLLQVSSSCNVGFLLRSSHPTFHLQEVQIVV